MAEPHAQVAVLTNRLLDRVTGAPCIGGAEHYALELGRLLRDLGLEPTFYQREGAWDRGEFFGFPVVSLPRGDHFSEFEPGVAKAFFDRTVDVDHIMYLAPNYASGPLREDALVVFHGVWWDHDLYRDGFAIRTPEWYEHLERVFMRPRRVVSVDANSISVVRGLFPAAAERMTLIPNWVDTERFHPPIERSRHQPLVLIPRRADVVRGLRMIEHILARLPDDCDVLWAGDGTPAANALLQRVAAADARFDARPATFDEMPELYRAADICVIPSVGSEGQSLACLEAMASGCAVVATRIGGLTELIDDGVTGLLCDPTPEAVAATTSRLLRDAPLRGSLGTAAHRAARRHSLELWRARWGSLLEDVGWVDYAGPARPFDVVCFSIIDWDFRWQRPQQLMALWGRLGRRVFYVRTTDLLTEGGDVVAVSALAENVWEVRIALSGPFRVTSGEHPDGFVEAGLAALHELVARFDIRSAVAIVQIAGWTPLATAARDELGWPIVYDCMDDWSTFPGICRQPALQQQEAELARRADRVVVSSDTIRRRWARVRPDVVLVRNAADFDFFRSAPGDDPLPDVAGPIAGFFGAIAEWFDFDLLAHAARVRPAVTFVLVGGIHRVSVDVLESIPNVRLEGLQPYATMPHYLRRFDVCLVPFEVSPVTDGMDVVKLYEYLSRGKPVVATRIRELVPHQSLVYLAGDRDEFVRQLDRALVEADDEAVARRVEFASRNSWRHRIATIEGAIGDVCALPPADSDAAADPADTGRITELEREIDRLHGEASTLRRALDGWRTSKWGRAATAYRRGRRALTRLLDRADRATAG